MTPTTPLKIECDVHFDRRGRGSRKVLETGPRPFRPAEPGRVPRVSRLMALAIRCDGLIRDGVLESYTEIARLGLLRTFQQTRIYPRMTCVENLVVSRPIPPLSLKAMFRRPSAAAAEEATELLEFVGLYQKRHLRAGDLSFGQQKLVELQNKRSELIARAKTAQAQQQVHEAVKSIDILDPTSEIGRFEDKIRREEAKARGQAEIAASSLDAQFNELDDLGELTEVEARLAQLKAGGSPSAQGQISGS